MTHYQDVLDKDLRSYLDPVFQWIDRANAGIAIAYALIAIAHALIMIAYEINQLPQDR